MKKSFDEKGLEVFLNSDAINLLNKIITKVNSVLVETNRDLDTGKKQYQDNTYINITLTDDEYVLLHEIKQHLVLCESTYKELFGGKK